MSSLYTLGTLVTLVGFAVSAIISYESSCRFCGVIIHEQSSAM